MDIEYQCDHCGRVVRGPGFYRHEESCRKRKPGPSTMLYPVSVPRDLYKKFAELCARKNETLQQGVVRLIGKEVEGWLKAAPS